MNYDIERDITQITKRISKELQTWKRKIWENTVIVAALELLLQQNNNNNNK